MISTPARRAALRAAGFAACGYCLLAGSAGATAPTFSVDYVVTVNPADTKVLDVRWELTGAEEIVALKLQAPPDRFAHFTGSGKVTVEGDTVTWNPQGPYAHLDYKASIAHQRGDRGRYDSFAERNWLVMRARDLFPRTLLKWEMRNGESAPRSRARLIFYLPEGWTSATAHPSVGLHEYALRPTGKALDRVRGWIALGELTVSHEEIDGVMLRFARVPGTKLPSADLFALLGDSVPRLRKLFGGAPEEILIVSAPDPMWRGGLSAYASLFMHGDRPLRTPDRTSPILHELFHVMQPFRTGKDADWIGEGLAEYYSLELQRRGGLLNDRSFGKGLASFAKYGLWDVNLTMQRDNAATNNSAPLVMYTLDQQIQRATAGQRRLDDVVQALSAPPAPVVTTTRFRQSAAKVADKDLQKFFTRYVVQGAQPPWRQSD